MIKCIPAPLNKLIDPIDALRVIECLRVENVAVFIHLKFPKKWLPMPNRLHRRRRTRAVARNRFIALGQPLDLLLRLRQLLLQLQHLQEKKKINLCERVYCIVCAQSHM